MSERAQLPEKRQKAAGYAEIKKVRGEMKPNEERNKVRIDRL